MPGINQEVVAGEQEGLLDPRTREIQDKIRSSIKNIAGDQNIHKYLNNIFEKMAAKQRAGQSLSILSITAIVVFDFGLLHVFKHFFDIVTIGRCISSPKYRKALQDPKFLEEVTNSNEVKGFLSNLKDHRAQLEAAIAYLINLPESDGKVLLDRKLVGAAMDFLEGNADLFSAQTIERVAAIILQKKVLEENLANLQTVIAYTKEATNPEKTQRLQELQEQNARLEEQISKQNLALVSVLLEIAPNFKGLESLIESKEAFIVNQISQLDLQGVKGLISQADAEKIFANIKTKDTTVKILAEGKNIIDLIAGGNMMKVSSQGMSLAAQHLPQILSVVGENPNILLAYCFEAKHDEATKEVTYKLSALGNTLEKFKAIKFKGENPAEWSVKFSNNEKGTITKEEFEGEILSKFDTVLVESALQAILTEPETINALASVTDDLGEDMPLFTWLSKALEMVNTNDKLSQALVTNKEQIGEIAKAAMIGKEEVLATFGLTPKFLEIAPSLLNDKDSINELYEIACGLGGDNNPQMTARVFELIRKNPKLQDFLSDPQQQKEIATLVKACGREVNVVKEYFNRPEFENLKQKVDEGLISTFPNLAKLLTNGEFLESIGVVMEQGATVNGFMFGPHATSIVDRQTAEQGSKDLYKYIIEGSNWDEAKIKEKFAVFGISSREELDKKIAEGKVASKALELSNEINSLFKADFPTTKPELASEEERTKFARNAETVNARNSAEKKIVLEILSANNDLTAVKSALKAAVEAKEISAKNAGFLVARLTRYGQDIPANMQKALIEGVLYENSLKQTRALDKIHPDVLLNVVEGIKAANAEQFSLETTKELLQNNSLVLSETEINNIAEALLQEREQISKTELVDALNDIAYRNKGGQGVGEMQDMLGSLLAPFADVMEQGRDAEYEKTVKVVNDLLQMIVEDPEMTATIATIVREKGADSLLSDKTELQKALRKISTFIEGLDQDHKEALSKMVGGILTGMNLSPSITNTAEKAVKEWGSQNLDQVADLLVEKNIASINGGKAILGALYNNPALAFKAAGSFAVNAGREYFKIGQVPEAIITALQARVAIIRGENKTPDIRGLLGRNVQGLTRADLSAKDFSRCLFYKMAFSGTKFGEVQYATFKDCTFDGCELPQTAEQLRGVTFDLKSFASFVANAEKKKLNLGMLLGEADIKVQTNTTKELEGQFVYAAIENLKQRGIEVSEKEIYYMAKSGAQLDNIVLSSLAHVSSSGQNRLDPSNNEVMNQFRDELNEIGFSKGFIRQAAYQSMNGKHPQFTSPFDQLRYGCLRQLGVARGNADRELAQERLRAVNEIQQNESSAQCFAMVLPEFSLEQGYRIIQAGVSYDFAELNKAQRQDLISFFKVNNELPSAQLKSELATLLSVMKSPHYEKVMKIAEQLVQNPVDRVKLYEKLGEKTPEKLNDYGMVLSGQQRMEDVVFDEADRLLEKWYINRATGANKPEAARGGDLAPVECLDKALEYKAALQNIDEDKFFDVKEEEFDEFEDIREESTTTRITKQVCQNLFGDISNASRTILWSNDRFDDLEKVYKAVKELVNSLSDKDKFGLEEVAAEIAGTSRETGITALIYPHTKYEMLSGGRNVYLPSNVTVEEIKNLVEQRISHEGIVVEQLIKAQPALEAFRQDLYNISPEVLKVIEENLPSFRQKAANQDMLPQLLTLHPSSMQKTLQMGEKTFVKVAQYSKRSNVNLEEIVQYSKVLGALQNLGKELEERYKLAGLQEPEKQALSIVVKVFNDSKNKQALRELVEDDKHHEMLANILFHNLNVREGKNLDEHKLDEVSKAISDKFSDKHTYMFAEAAQKQGREIAEKVFAAHKIAENWKDEAKTEASIKNLSNLLGARIFAGANLIPESKIKSVVEQTASEYRNIYYTMISWNNPWYEVGKYDAKDNHTKRMVECFEKVLENVNAQAMNQGGEVASNTSGAKANSSKKSYVEGLSQRSSGGSQIIGM